MKIYRFTIDIPPLTPKKIKKCWRIRKQVLRFYGIKQKGSMKKGGLR
jgi:ribosomal protein S6